MGTFLSFLQGVLPNSFIIHPEPKPRQGNISTKNAANRPAKHRICWKTLPGPTFALNRFFECGILSMLCKNPAHRRGERPEGKGSKQ